MTDPGDAAALAHELLVARDRVLGVEAENARLRERLAALESEPISAAYERIEKLEDQREALLDVINQLRVQADEVAGEIRSSRTWRTGRLVLAPISLLRRLGRPAR